MPLLWKPQLHALTTGVGYCIGVYCSKTEDRYFDWVNRMYAVPEDAPLWMQRKIKARFVYIRGPPIPATNSFTNLHTYRRPFYGFFPCPGDCRRQSPGMIFLARTC
eukprot:sb/3477808/